VLRDPYQLNCCGKSFCYECIDRVRESDDPSCPCCTCKDVDFYSFADKRLQQTLYEFKVYCTYKSNGCEWTGELRELDGHLNLDPPSAGKFLEGCPFATIDCPLAYAGCKVRLTRQEVKEHLEKEIISHALMQSTLLLGLQTENSCLRANLELTKEDMKELKIEQQCVSLSSVEFTIENFKNYSGTCVQWYSPPFHTHLFGYKMCLSVWAYNHMNHDSEEEEGENSARCGSFLSVGVVMMSGEHDRKLKWPFRGDITVQLIDQERDSHVSKVISFTDDTPNNVAGRVAVYMKKNARACCENKFIALKKLRPKYLKNNSLRFRVSKVSLK
jgi:TNF receptor-associated factor 4